MSWTAIRYRDFYDLPRIFITTYQGRQYLFDCPFDDELDDYPDSYSVYELPALSKAELQGSWEQLSALATAFLGRIPVARVQFDPTKRASINTAIFSELPEPQTTRVA
ncbi:MAG TPA: hypothetical protein VNQ79_05250 [Blastocatellia bacterium]|nr:hypothetical protein [Blastocatellia bacterium]